MDSVHRDVHLSSKERASSGSELISGGRCCQLSKVVLRPFSVCHRRRVNANWYTRSFWLDMMDCSLGSGGFGLVPRCETECVATWRSHFFSTCLGRIAIIECRTENSYTSATKISRSSIAMALKKACLGRVSKSASRRRTWIRPYNSTKICQGHQ